MPTSEHVFIYGSSFLGDDWTAGCTCGWEALDTFTSEARAQEAWENHCDVLFMESTMRSAD